MFPADSEASTGWPSACGRPECGLCGRVSLRPHPTLFSLDSPLAPVRPPPYLRPIWERAHLLLGQDLKKTQFKILEPQRCANSRTGDTHQLDAGTAVVTGMRTSLQAHTPPIQGEAVKPTRAEGLSCN